MDNDVNPTTKNVLSDLDASELKSIAFWVSQIFIMVSTIIVVYLAAQSGLEQALKFDDFRQMEDNYYLRASLYDEVSDNVIVVKAYSQNILARSLDTQSIKKNRPQLQQYIWQTMQYSPSTLETPSVILSGVRRFYSDADDIMEKAGSRFYASREAGIKLDKAILEIETVVLPKIKASMVNLKAKLEAEGLDVGSLKEVE